MHSHFVVVFGFNTKLPSHSLSGKLRLVLLSITLPILRLALSTTPIIRTPPIIHPLPVSILLSRLSFLFRIQIFFNHLKIRRHLHHLHRRCTLETNKLCQQIHPNTLQRSLGIHILPLFRGQMELEIRSIILIVIIVRNLIWQFHIQQYRRFICPTPCHIANRIPSSTQHQRRNIKALCELDTLRMSLQTKVEAPKSIPRQRVGTTL
mmetsp:Transcript_20377/g.43967  ORF Transcript_20377/g.43967 Transcript_20377/m.43967 type:complete len:207 (+) Transcript_20377:603-1223(+)